MSIPKLTEWEIARHAVSALVSFVLSLFGVTAGVVIAVLVLQWVFQ